MKTKKRAMKAIGRYLELKGYEILEEGWCHGRDKVDYIIDDYGCIAFVFGHAEENAGRASPKSRSTARDSSAWPPHT